MDGICQREGILAHRVNRVHRDRRVVLCNLELHHGEHRSSDDQLVLVHNIVEVVEGLVLKAVCVRSDKFES